MKNSEENTAVQNNNDNLTSGKNLSCWFDKVELSDQFNSLTENTETDVVIVGGGISGLTSAYCIAKSGKKVIVIEDGFIGSGETGRTTAQIVTALDDRYYNMENVFGKENTALIAESHLNAIQFIEEVIIKEGIDCDFEKVNGYLFLHSTDKEESLEKESDALKRCNLPGEILKNTPGIPTEKKSILFPAQAQLHPLKYIYGLVKAIEKMGGKIYTKTHASEIDYKGIKSDKGFTVKAQHIIVATNAPVNDKYAMMLKQWAYRSYVIAAYIKKDVLPKAMWWDTGDQSTKGSNAYHYVRLQPFNDEFDLLISGGEDHKVGKSLIPEDEHFIKLEKWTRERFPINEIHSKWSGEVLVPMDSIAYLGKNRFDKENVYIITGDAGIGMTYCTTGALLITDLINGVENKFEDIYKPSRFSMKASGPFFEMLKSDTLEVLKKWFYSPTAEIESIKNDEAMIVDLDGKICGAYKDSAGKLFLVSAECSHLKCMVSWNNSEKSWDCPCHGSRFTYTGKVINGPANEDLQSFTE